MSCHFGPARATFIHIPKCAGTSIKRWARKGPGARPGPKHIKIPVARRHYKTPGVFFAVVRNPYERAVSLFHFCGQLGTSEINLGGPRYPVFNVWKKLYGQGFGSFLSALSARDASVDTIDRNWHLWDNQYSWIEDDPDTIVLRHENLDHDFRQIQDMLGCHDSLPRENASQHEDYRQYLTDDIRRRIESIWAQDIEKFGYQA